MNNYVKVKLKTYSQIALLDLFQREKVSIHSLEQISDFEFVFECKYTTYKKLKKKYKDLQIMHNINLNTLFLELFSRKLVLFCLIISVFFFYFLSNRIMCIEIKGISQEFNTVLYHELETYDITKYNVMPSLEKLKEIENSIRDKYYNELDIFSLIKKGNYIILNYEKKKEQIIIDNKKTSIYSKKDAIISKIMIGSGEVLVKENQYVKEGELLVKDSITNNDKEIYVGTSGLIYGYSFSKVQISYIDKDFDQVIIDSRYLISKNFQLDEKIISENIIYDNKEEKILVIHYKCEEILNSY